MRRVRLSTTSAIVALAMVWCAATGCTQKRQFQPEVSPDELSDIGFLHYLETVPVATFGEGCRAMLIAADGSDPYDDHASRYAELKNRGWVRDAWGLESDDVLDMGTMCYMAADLCNLKPSACTVLLGSWGLGDRRYAIRQCVDARLVGHAPSYKPVTGGALVWTMGRTEDFVTAAGAYSNASEAAPKNEARRSDLLAE